MFSRTSKSLVDSMSCGKTLLQPMRLGPLKLLQLILIPNLARSTFSLKIKLMVGNQFLSGALIPIQVTSLKQLEMLPLTARESLRRPSTLKPWRTQIQFQLRSLLPSTKQLTPSVNPQPRLSLWSQIPQAQLLPIHHLRRKLLQPSLQTRLMPLRQPRQSQPTGTTWRCKEMLLSRLSISSSSSSCGPSASSTHISR